MGEFGEKFRKERETRNLTLDDVSKVTKISPRMLQAIEEQKFDVLPGGVFNKGFIRAYAKHLGINDEEAVTEYLDCLRQAQIAAQAVWEPPSREAVPPNRPVPAAGRHNGKPDSPSPADELAEMQLPRPEHVRRPRQKYLRDSDAGIPWRLLAAAAIVAVLVFLLWRRHARLTESESVPQAQPTVSQNTAPPVTNAPAGPDLAAGDRTAAANVPAAGNGAAQSASKQTSPGNSSASNSSNGKAGASVAPSTKSSASSPQGGKGGNSPNATTGTTVKPDADVDQNDVTTRTPATSQDAAQSKPLTLVIRASENSWIAVTADGQTVSRETLIAPANTSVHARREIVAKVGNAAGVTFLWNGQEIPPQGNEAEVKTFVFDAQGMRVLPPPQSQTP